MEEDIGGGGEDRQREEKEHSYTKAPYACRGAIRNTEPLDTVATGGQRFELICEASGFGLAQNETIVT